VLAEFEITDDAGFLALVDCNAYASYVAAEPDMEKLRIHLLDAMRGNQILVWATGRADFWKVSVRTFAPEAFFRSATGYLRSTGGEICLSNWEDLAYAARFTAAKLPLPHHHTLFYKLRPGDYRVDLYQIRDPRDFHRSVDADFVIKLDRVDTGQSAWSEILWLGENERASLGNPAL